MSDVLSSNDLLAAGEGADSPAELYHENSKQRRSDRAFIERIVATGASPALHQMMFTSRKRYRAAARTPLPRGTAAGELEQIIERRRSCRAFGDGPVALGDVAAVMRLAAGETARADEATGRPRAFRAAPSAGALFPLEVYLVSDHVEDLARGVHRYDPADHLLECIDATSRLPQAIAATGMDELASAAAVIVLTAIPARSRLKYGERAYRFILLEAGHVAQNVLLAAEGLGLAACAVGGFVDDELDAVIGIDGVDEISLYAIALGRPKPLALEVLASGNGHTAR
jgi:SagB-type dehydrogenase family enzyme